MPDQRRGKSHDRNHSIRADVPVCAMFVDGSMPWIESKKQESTLRTLVPRNGR
jgi:hypothetical protein